MTLPALFVSHGAPTLGMTDCPTRDFLKALPADLSRPKAILAISAHWETSAPRVSSLARQTTIHDFYGFPPELYAMRYEPPGAPDLAQRVVDILQDAGLKDAALDGTRGLDHGAWVPLELMYPDADIPVIQLSIQPHRGAAYHHAIGEALGSLRDEGILIFASGSLTHNLREFRPAYLHGSVDPKDWVLTFQKWVADAIAKNDLVALEDFDTAPEGKRNHPTDEHFLPIFVAMGAGGLNKAKRLHDEVMYSILAMDAYSFG
ncbi:dioxygenase [Rhodospirillaceae bacterium KN72]|uniref:Dioxygenase n=1 Tax=Pacificispira spongiicola TaxID=2729598 RepID=A0A7Y0E1Z4_9PROT|nr:class III extradiol ring-cleavage dioxygenase [Pacificispira spongiicola]NMM45760.1 dioxygenase [Pacificispira spongiicola]